MKIELYLTKEEIEIILEALDHESEQENFESSAVHKIIAKFAAATTEAFTG